jgi:hypothetical protein
MPFASLSNGGELCFHVQARLCYFYLFIFSVLGFELRACTLSHSTSLL